jgi:hypothetical protein
MFQISHVSKSMFSLILHFYVVGMPVWFAPLTRYIILVYCLKNNIGLYVFLDVQNALHITTRLIKYCNQVVTSNRKQIQPLIIFLTYMSFHLPTSTYDLSGFMYVRGIADTSFMAGFTTFSGSSSRIFSTTLPICFPDPINLETKYVGIFIQYKYEKRDLRLQLIEEIKHKWCVYIYIYIYIILWCPSRSKLLQLSILIMSTCILLLLKL